MSSTNHKLRLAGALAVLGTLALAVSCQGFFPHATLTSITLSPSAPSFDIGFQQPMQAWGTDNNNNRYQLGSSSGVQWSLSSPVPLVAGQTVATINESTGTMTGVSAGTISVTATAQGLSASATATVNEVVTSMSISPSSNSTLDDGSTPAKFEVFDQNNNNISGLVTLTAYPFQQTSGTPVSGITCSYVSSDTPPDQQCIASNLGITTTTKYTVLVTYSGYTGSQVTATLSVSP